MPTSTTINVADLTDQDAVLRVLQGVQDHGTSYSLLQNGVTVAMMVPPVEEKVEEKNDKVSDEVTQKRWETLEKIEVLSKKIGHLWNTDETAAEAVANDRR